MTRTLGVFSCILIYLVSFMSHLFVVSGADATNFAIVGPRATGMAGAQVATPDKEYGFYWNPAFRVEEQREQWTVIFPTAGYHVEQHNQVFKRLDDILDVLGEYSIFDDELSNDSEAVQAIQEIVNKLDKKGTGLVTDAHSGILFRKNNLSFGYFALAFGGISLIVDTKNLDVGDEYLSTSIENNESAINSWGIISHQLVAGSNFTVFDFDDSRDINHVLSFGYILKYIYGFTYTYYASVYDKDIDDSKKESPFSENERHSGAFSCDLGFLYSRNERFQVGLLIRDCTRPAFDKASLETSQTESIQLPIQGRLGFSYSYPYQSVVFAADIDLTENDSSTGDGYKDRRVGLAVEKGLWGRSCFIRTGYYQNIAENGRDSVLTLGLALRIKRFELNIAAGISPSNYGSDELFYIDETIGAFHIAIR